MDEAQTQIEADTVAIAEALRERAHEMCPPDSCGLAPQLDECIDQVIAELADSPVRSFVPLLALRRVKGCIRVGTCETREL